MSRPDRLAASLLWAAVFVIFGAGAPRLGFYYDDAPALADLRNHDAPRLLRAACEYVPGRNLHVVWQYLFVQVSPSLAVLHVVQSALDGLVVAVFYVLLRRLAVAAPAAAVAAALFGFWPTHGETHFWLYAVPQNIVSTLFVLLFALASRPLVRCLGFLAALFTYDQTVFVVLLILLAHARRRRHWSQLVCLAGAALFCWLKFIPAAHRGPELRPGALRAALANVPAALAVNFGPPLFRHVSAMAAKAAPEDWVLAGAATAVLSVCAWRLRRTDGGHAPGFAPLAALAFVAAYLPAWLWHMSQRHHYLPSAALFALAAAWLCRVRPPSAIAPAAIPLLLFAAASRGESRYWEESYAMKKQLFAGMQNELRSNEILVLEGFPAHHGPAYFITPLDPLYAPRLLVPGSTISHGDISGFPAPHGVFLYTNLHLYGPDGFRYYPSGRVIWRTPASLSRPPLFYRHLPAPEPLTPGCRRDGSDTLLSVRFPQPAAPGHHSAAAVSFLQPNGQFHPWKGPILLDSGPEHALRLLFFPETPRARIEFYELAPGGPPRRRGTVQLACPS